MAAPRFAWGIDIGNRALKAVKLVPTADGLAIDDFDVIEHETVLSTAGDNRESLIQTALATFVQRHPGIDKGQVGVGVTGQQSFARFIKLPPVEPSKIPEIVRFEAIQQIPFPLDEVEWSYQLFQDPESPDVEVGIFAMRKELINQHIKYFTDAKLNVQAVQMNQLAVYNAMYYDSRVKGTTMIVDIGAENTDLIIAEGETIWLRSISIGGNNFTEALSKAFRVDFVKAEELKRNASTSKYGRQIMQAMRPIFADLVSEIQRSIGFYSSVHKESRITRVMAMGSTFRLPGLQKYLSQNLTLEVDKLDRLGTGAIEDPKLAASFSDNLLSAAGAYGLALQVMGQGKISSSLLPERIRREKMWAEKTRWFGAAAALFVVGAGVAYGRYFYDNSQMNSAESEEFKGKIVQVTSQASGLDSKWSKIESAGGPERLRVQNVVQLTAGRQLLPELNRALIAALPQQAPGVSPALISNDPAELKKISRNARDQIFVSNMTSKYFSDMAAKVAPGYDLSPDEDKALGSIPAGGGGGGGDIGSSGFSLGNRGGTGFAAADPSATPTVAVKPLRGYIITLKLSTPKAQGVALVENYNNALRALEAGPDRPFEFRNAKIVSQGIIRENKARVDEIGKAYMQAHKPDNGFGGGGPGGLGGGPGGAGPGSPGGAPGGGFGGFTTGAPGGLGRGDDRPGFGGPGGPGLAVPGGGGLNGGEAKVPEEAYLDPVLKEDIRDDTECVVVLAVVLDPPAKPKTPPKAVAINQP